MADKRQELYERIRASSKDEVILEEMIRLGFWPAQGEPGVDPAGEIRERGELERRLAALRTEQARLHDIEAIKRALRKQRLEASRAKQRATKERRAEERLARAQAWAAAKATDIGYLGAGVSGGLQARQSDAAMLARHGVPALHTPAQVAAAMGLTVPQLRFLTFARTTSTVSHYRRFDVAKKTGGTRRISAPMPRLKAAQRWVLDHVLAKVAVHDAAHGFRAARSIVTNAAPHVGAGVVINVDLRDFFPTLTYPRIRGVFRGLGYSEAAATVFALLCSEPEVDEVELDGQAFFVASGVRRLPQGAPTSPMITNIVCRRLDARLHGAATKLGFAYTRYADDLTFSGPATADVGAMLDRVRLVTTAEGFVEHPDKTRVLRRGRRQEVTGVVVNQQLGVDRATLRRFRALLFQIDKDGPAGKTWGHSPDLFAAIIGFANYVHMVDPAKGAALATKARELAARHGWQPARRPPPKPKAPSSASGASGAGAAATSAPPPATGAATPATPPTIEASPPATEPPTDEPPKKKKKWWQIF
ncbi:MAG: reverse transcriptase family protein [Kofleriaceae bacterium]